MRSALPMTNSQSGRPSHVRAYSESRVRVGAAFCSACRYCAICSGVVIAVPGSCPTTCLSVGMAGSYFAPGQSSGSWAEATRAISNKTVTYVAAEARSRGVTSIKRLRMTARRLNVPKTDSPCLRVSARPRRSVISDWRRSTSTSACAKRPILSSASPYEP